MKAFGIWALVLAMVPLMAIPVQGQDSEGADVPEAVTELRKHAGQRFQNARMAAQAERFDLVDSEYEAVVESFTAIFALGHGDPREYLLAAELHGFLGRPEKAIELLESGAAKFPDDAGLAIGVAGGLSSTGKFPEAYEKYKEIDARWGTEPNEVIDDRFYFAYGAAAERIKKYEEAAMLFRLAIQLAPRGKEPYRAAQAMNYLGYMWLETGGDVEQAGRMIERANQLVPGEAAYIDSLGWYYFKKGSYEDALRQLLRVEELADLESPDDAIILDHIGQTYFQLGHEDKAADYLRRAVELDSESEQAPTYQRRLKQFETLPTPPRVPLDFLDEDGDEENGD